MLVGRSVWRWLVCLQVSKSIKCFKSAWKDNVSVHYALERMYSVYHAKFIPNIMIFTHFAVYIYIGLDPMQSFRTPRQPLLGFCNGCKKKEQAGAELCQAQV